MMASKENKETKTSLHFSRKKSEAKSGSFVIVKHKDPKLGKGKMKGKAAKGVIPDLPPRLQLTPHINQVFRFKAGSEGSVTPITVSNLISAMGVIASSTTSVHSVCDAVRVLSVTAFPPAGTASNSTVSLSWQGGSSGQMDDEFFDESIPEGITSTKSLKFVPPPKSLASFWIDSAQAADTVFDVDCPSGTILDVHLHGAFSVVFGNITTTVTGAEAGILYFLPLDGVGDTLVPTSLVSVA
jgi:hypothetical protein